MKTCREEGCEGEVHKLGRCFPCHRLRYNKYAQQRRQRVREYKAIHGQEPVYIKPTLCMTEGCDQPREKIGRCIAHYREHERIRHSEWVKENPEKSKETARRFYANNTEKCRAKAIAFHKTRRQKQLQLVGIPAELARCKIRGDGERTRAKRITDRVFAISEKELFKIYNSPCFYCGSEDRISMDHVVPLSRGGSHGIGNIVSACVPCNSQKNSKCIMEFRLWLNRMSKFLPEEHLCQLNLSR